MTAQHRAFITARLRAFIAEHAQHGYVAREWVIDDTGDKIGERLACDTCDATIGGFTAADVTPAIQQQLDDLVDPDEFFEDEFDLTGISMDSIRESLRECLVFYGSNLTGDNLRRVSEELTLQTAEAHFWRLLKVAKEQPQDMTFEEWVASGMLDELYDVIDAAAGQTILELFRGGADEPSTKM